VLRGAVVTFALVFGAFGVGDMSPSQGFIGGMGRIPGLKAGTRVSPDGTAVNARRSSWSPAWRSSASAP
jgi:hypothetical protein